MAAIFSTIRVVDGRVWFAAGHRRRLGIDIEDAVLRAAAGRPDARVRVVVEPGRDAAIEVFDYEPRVHAWRLQPVEVSPPEDTVRLKTTERVFYEAAEKRAAGMDDALLHLEDGTLLECTRANIFLRFGDSLLTPPASAPLLPGIARERVLASAAGVGLRSAEAPLRLEDVREADAIVVTNALMVAHPVREIAGLGRYDSEGLARLLISATSP